MISFRDGFFYFDIERCCQCGTCFAACRRSALSSELRPDGLHEIKRDKATCSGCGACEEVCPARRLPEHIFTKEDWGGFKALYLGRSADVEVASAASSGGVARTFIKVALERSICKKAYCLVTADSYPWAEGRFVERDFDISSIANSMYLPILVNANMVKSKKGESLLVIGTNCQLLGVENLFQKSNNEIIKIALLCKQQKTLAFTKFIGRRLGEDVVMDTPIGYRGHGWPGSTRIGKKKIGWPDAATLPFGKKLWMVPGCRFCGNLFGHNADITLSDPWGLSAETACGENLVWVRTAKGLKFLESCGDALILNKISKEPFQAQKHVDWEKYIRKQALIPHYLGEPLPLWTQVVTHLADLQRRFYENLLSRVSLPNIVLKIINRLPFAEDLL